MSVFFLNPENALKARLFAGDLVLAFAGALAALVAAAWWVGGGIAPAGPLREAWVLAVPFLQCTVAFLLGLYDSAYLYRKGRQGTQLMLAMGVGVLLYALLAALAHSRHPVLHGAVLYGGFTGIAIGAWRLEAIRRWRASVTPRRLVFVGPKAPVEGILDALTEVRRPDLVPVCAVTDSDAALPPGLERRELRSGLALEGLMREVGANEVVLCGSSDVDPETRSQLVRLGITGTRISPLSRFGAEALARIPLESIDSEWVLQELHPGREDGRWGIVRRALDVALAGALLVLGLPFMLALALAIRLESPGSPLFVQRRLGVGKREFDLIKYRTMVRDAEQATGPTWASDEDPRITRVGSLLRTTGLDELPQLLNILRGDMTFIGPRPIRRHFAELLAAEIPFYDLRFYSRPGVTGWGQVRGDYAGSVRGQRVKLEYELYYLKYASPGLDLYIVLKTLQKLVRRRVGTHDTPAEDMSR